MFNKTVTQTTTFYGKEYIMSGVVEQIRPNGHLLVRWSHPVPGKEDFRSVVHSANVSY